MWNLSIFMPALMTLILTMLCPPCAFAVDGPGGTGGGSLPQEAMASPEEIKAVVEKAIPRLVMLTKGIQIQEYKFGQKHRAAYLKLFNDDPDYRSIDPYKLEDDALAARVPIYRELVGAQFQMDFRNPCYDRLGHPQDASVIDSSRRLICVSVFRLSKRVLLNRLYAQVHALLLHEVSHLTGTSEEEARFVQSLADQSTPKENPKPAYKLGQDLEGALQWWSLGNDAILHLELNHRPESRYPHSFTESCVAIGSVGSNVEEAINSFNAINAQYGTEAFTLNDQSFFNGLVVKSFMLKLYCLEEDNWNKKMFRTLAFKGKSSAPVNEFSRYRYSEIELFRGYDFLGIGTVRYISFKDQRALQASIDEIQAGLKVLIDKAHNFIWSGK